MQTNVARLAMLLVLSTQIQSEEVRVPLNDGCVFPLSSLTACGVVSGSGRPSRTVS